MAHAAQAPAPITPNPTGIAPAAQQRLRALLSRILLSPSTRELAIMAGTLEAAMAEVERTLADADDGTKHTATVQREVFHALHGLASAMRAAEPVRIAGNVLREAAV